MKSLDDPAGPPGRGTPRPRRALLSWLGRLSPDVGPLRRSRDFRLLYAGRGASIAGSMITYVAMPYQAYQLTRSSLVVGLLSAAELVPLVAAALLGGLLADAMDRRWLVRVTEAGLAAGSLLLAANAVAWQQLWVLFAVAVTAAALAGLQRPSVDAFVTRLVGRADMPAAAALNGLQGNAGYILGPLVAGGLIAAGGLAVSYAVDVASCGVALVAFGLMRASPPPPDAARPSLPGLREGYRYVRGRPELLGSYLIDLAAMFAGAPFALFPAIAVRLGGPGVLGLLYAAPGLGTVAVNLTSGWTRRVHRHGRAIVLAVCGWGVAIAAFGFAANVAEAVAALAVAGAADMISGLFRMTMWNQTIPDALRGRLAGLEMISYTAGEPLGNLESGLAAAVAGLRAAVVAGGLACLLGAAVLTAALPRLWHYDAREPVPEGEPGQPARVARSG
jgi:MFS family permease